MTYRTSIVIAFCLTVTLAACVDPPGRELDQLDPERVERTATVKIALIDDADVSAASIRVLDEDEGIVLDGFVASEEEREAALAAARTAMPGETIVDRLKLR